MHSDNTVYYLRQCPGQYQLPIYHLGASDLLTNDTFPMSLPKAIFDASICYASNPELQGKGETCYACCDSAHHVRSVTSQCKRTTTFT